MSVDGQPADVLEMRHKRGKERQTTGLRGLISPGDDEFFRPSGRRGF